MAFDFPNTPSVGDLFQDSSSGAVYRWNGYAWVGGVTGIGLQTIKETRYLVAGSFTFTRDPKSSGFGDIHLAGSCGGRPAGSNPNNICLGGGGGTGGITIKWRYPLPATAPVVIGASSTTAGVQSGLTSFDTVLTALGGFAGQAGTVAPAVNAQTGGGTGAAPSATGDENYGGITGAMVSYISSLGITAAQTVVYLRGIVRFGGAGAVALSPLAAAGGNPGAVIVVEYLNP